MKHHDRPWKCSIEDCEYAEGGFLSRKMRDDHYRSHRPPHRSEGLDVGKLDVDEIQPLLFDLIKANEVNAFKSLLDQYETLGYSAKHSLQECAVTFGSVEMIDLIEPFEKTKFPSDCLKLSMKTGNKDIFNHLMSRSIDCNSDIKCHTYDTYAGLLPAVLVSDSEEYFETWVRYVHNRWQTVIARHGGYPTIWSVQNELFPLLQGYRNVVDNPGRQNLLIIVWDKVEVLKFLDRTKLNVIFTKAVIVSLSIKIVEYLLDGGAEVDVRRSDFYLTPLHSVARQTSAAAAEMMKFLLLRGADPELKAERSRLSIREEKGAKNIARWLGMSWDELVAKTHEERAMLSQ
jgi:hypothetical protein